MSRTEPSFAERVCLLDTPWASGTRRRSHERRRTARPAVDPRHFAWTAIVCKLRQEVATWPRSGAQAGGTPKNACGRCVWGEGGKRVCGGGGEGGGGGVRAVRAVGAVGAVRALRAVGAGGAGGRAGAAIEHYFLFSFL